MKRSALSVLAERRKQRAAVTPTKAKVRHVRFSPEELVYDVPADTSGFKPIGRGPAAIFAAVTRESTAVKAILKRRSGEYFLCLHAGKSDGDLVVGKVYRSVRSLRGDPATDVRLIDESGDDYLYPAKWFVPVELPTKAKRALQAH